ncbi:MAG: hypothetical protein FJ293_02365 [Planctomycetes bacterium]|nr:hypothetical protein [Planctomycetota bacterium]
MPDALAVIHDLAAFPPLNEADLRERTRGCSRESLVAAIEAAIEDSDSEIEQSGLLEVLEKVDPQHEWLNAATATAAGTPGGGAPEPALLHEIPAELEHELIEAVAHLVATPADAGGISERVLLLAPPLQARLIKRLDRARVEAGVPAPLLFEPLLAKPLAAEARAAVDAALAEEATRRRVVEGFAWLASCDGTGAASLFAGLRNPDGTHTVVHVVYDVHAGIRDVLVLARQTKKAVERMQEQMRGNGVEFARVPIELAARLVADAAERGHAAGVTLPAEAEQALALLAPVKLAPRPSRPSPLLVAMPPAPVEQLFQRAEYASWFLDAGELLDAGVTRPAPGLDPSEWVDQALPKLDRPELRARVSAMAAHMGHWHELRREPQLAALLRALAWPASRSFVGDAVAEHAEAASPCSGAPANELFFGLVARSFFLAQDQLVPPSVLADAGDPQFRQGLKERQFAKVEQPTGRDLARLDLAELFLLLFESALPVIAPPRRPRSDELEPLALRLADAVIAWREGGVGRRSAVEESLAKALIGAGSRLTAGDAALLAEQFTPALIEEFLRRACGACPIRCWDALDAAAAAPFFATQHPASALLEEFAEEQAAAAEREEAGEGKAPAADAGDRR